MKNIIAILLALGLLSACSQKPETAQEAFEVALSHLAEGDIDAYFDMTVDADKRYEKLATLDKETKEQLAEFYQQIGNDYTTEVVETDCDSEIELRLYDAQTGCSFMVGFNHKSDKKKNVGLQYYYAMKVDGQWKVDFPF